MRRYGAHADPASASPGSPERRAVPSQIRCLRNQCDHIVQPGSGYLEGALDVTPPRHVGEVFPALSSQPSLGAC
jgi:hypothetical protein